MNRTLVLILILVPLAFVLFLVGVFAGVPGLLLVVIALLVAAGIVNRKKPELLKSLLPQKKPRQPEMPQFQPAGSTDRFTHEPLKKTYLELTSVNASSRKSIVMDKADFLIGRSSVCDHVIDNSEVSGRHLRLEYREGDKLCYATDLDSTNYTHLNGTRLNRNRAYPLRQGDILQIANEVYQVEYAHF